MKKPTKKTTLPATPAPAPVVKKAKAAPAKAKVVKEAEAKPAVKPAAKKPAAKRAAAPAPAPSVPVAPVAETVIEALVDVGFGNTLYLRGEGPGLSWETGVVMQCVSDDKWSLTLENAASPVVFKVLLNDETWCAGEDFVAAAGSSTQVVPVF